MLHGNFWREKETFSSKKQIGENDEKFSCENIQKICRLNNKIISISRLICYPKKHFEFLNLLGNFSLGAMNRLWWEFDGMQEIEG